jgi:hypothetical protein
MQFYDTYNPKIGIGLAFITHNLNYAPLVYSLGKNDRGVTGFIKYSKEFYNVEPNQIMEYNETALVFHKGKWQEAAAAYKDWVKTWYVNKPKSRDWFNKISLLKDYFLAEEVCWKDLKVPPMYSKTNKKFQISEFLEKDKEYWGGLSPDLIHFYRWFHTDGIEGGKANYGGTVRSFGEYSYDNLGGLDSFKLAINNIQKDYNIPVSLYYIPDRCSIGTPFYKRAGAGAVIIRADGSKLGGGNMYGMCIQQKDWQDFIVETAEKVQKETNANCVYLDVFGLWHTNVCYSKKHGHKVPSWYAEGTHELIKRIRDVLPQHVALWTEFPLADLNAQFVDGNIEYYHLSLNETFAKSYDTLDEQALQYSSPSITAYRFLFPDVKQFDLAAGVEGAVNSINMLKFTFFNGDAIYDNGWFVYKERTRKELMIKSTAIKKKFRDCFYSSNISPLVETERAYVYANKFAGEDKTVWTIYNGRYNTVKGPVLAIEHKEGCKYYDAWNDKMITPAIVNGRAIITQKLDPQAVGCIVQYEKGIRNNGQSEEN